MKFEIKTYKNHKYIQYIDESQELNFTNSEYFIFDTICDDFKAIMRSTGGFTAEMTTRMIKKLNIACESIMLCCTPHNNNTFLFQFVYLDKDRNVLNVEWDNNYFDYQYFKKKFAICIIEQGCIFDLLKYDYLKEVTKEFKEPTLHFDIKINDREITTNDILVCTDLCFLKEDYITKFRNFGVIKAELLYDYDCLNASHFKAKFIKEDGSYLPDYQGRFECNTIEEFIEEYGTIDHHEDPFETVISTSVIRHLADHFKLKNI